MTTTSMQPETPTPSEQKPDNLFGVCAALGEDFGFNPLWLRIVLGAGVLWNPLGVLAIYVALGAAVLATRLLFPDRKPAAPVDRLAAPAPAPDAANSDEPVLARAA